MNHVTPKIFRIEKRKDMDNMQISLVQQVLALLNAYCCKICIIFKFEKLTKCKIAICPYVISGNVNFIFFCPASMFLMILCSENESSIID